MTYTPSVCLHIIVTFKSKQQQFFEVTVKENITRKGFIETIIDNLNKDDGKDIVKISACQLNTSTMNNLIPLMKYTLGKFYFNTSVNNDEETNENETILHNYFSV